MTNQHLKISREPSQCIQETRERQRERDRERDRQTKATIYNSLEKRKNGQAQDQEEFRKQKVHASA